MYENSYSVSQVESEQRSFINKVYGWMALGLGITAFVAYYVVSNPPLFKAIVGNTLLFFGMIIGEFILVGWLARNAMKMSVGKTTTMFLAYSALNGLTLSVIFAVYTMESIGSVFLITAGMFAVMSTYGFVTKKDLTSMGQFMIMGLFGIIIASIVNIFLRSSGLHWIISFIGVIVFVGLTAYDTQKIKNMNIIGNEGTDEDRKESILGALILYLDFINLFLMLLRLFGTRRR
ncbi:Bax inhibitor-1/YccA family protein [bacterium]